MRKSLLFLVPTLTAVVLIATATAQNDLRPHKEKIRSGRMLFAARGCSSCHAIGGKGPKTGPDLLRLTAWVSPVLGAAAMWNHVPLMAKEREKRGLPWPDFTARDVLDIFTYLHSLKDHAGGSKLSPGKAITGEALYGVTCIKCHGNPFAGGLIGPDLGVKAAGMKTRIEFAARMLRHAPKMAAVAERLNYTWPRLTGEELSHIFAYLRSLPRARK